MVTGDATQPPSPGMLRSGPRQIWVIVGICLAVLFLAYVVFSDAIVNGVASAAGARPDNSFDALWFADPSVASGPISRGTAVTVAISNRTRGVQTLQWSTSSLGSQLQHGSIRVPEASTRTFVVLTRDAAPNGWFWVRLAGTSIAIKAWIGS